MEFQLFTEKLSKRLTEDLPGENAQFLMAPGIRKKFTEIIADTAIKPRLSAVLILIYPDLDYFKTILIKRPVYEGVHSGQIAFPGGKFENEDIDLLHTAIREAKEEIGVEVKSNDIVGSLSDVYIYPSNFLVKPFIAVIDSKPKLILDSREVELHIETDILMLQDELIKKEIIINYANGLKLKTPYYDVEGFTVWGATAMIISELNAVLSNL